MSHHKHQNLIVHKMPTSLFIIILLCDVAWDIHCPHISGGAFFSDHSRIFPETRQPAKYVWVWVSFCCSYHKYPPCMAPDVMKWWMWSSLAFPKSRSRFLLQSDPKQIVGMSWALLLSLTQLLLELLNSFINLSPISKTGGGREWWTALRKAQKEPIQGYLMPNSHRSCCCLFVPRGKTPGNLLRGE